MNERQDMNIKIGTRGSKLALVQANTVVESIKKSAPEITPRFA